MQSLKDIKASLQGAYKMSTECEKLLSQCGDLLRAALLIYEVQTDKEKALQVTKGLLMIMSDLFDYIDLPLINGELKRAIIEIEKYTEEVKTQ